jgi:uncharacterized membrane protein YczE
MWFIVCYCIIGLVTGVYVRTHLGANLFQTIISSIVWPLTWLIEIVNFMGD